MRSLHFCAAVWAASFIALSGPSVAEEPALPPVIRPLPESATLPADGVFDVLGKVRLGMTQADAMAALRSLDTFSEPTLDQMVTGLGDNRDNQFAFLYPSTVMVGFRVPDGPNDQLSLTFTTNVNEARVMVIRRHPLYMAPQQGDAAAFIDGLIAKYGPPSFRIDRAGTQLFWVWFEGVRQTLTAEQVKKGGRGTPGSCAARSGVLYSYQAEDERPGCTVTIFVSIDRGTRDDLMTGATIEMYDFERARQNVKDTDAWVDDELEKVISGTSGGAAPKL